MLTWGDTLIGNANRRVALKRTPTNRGEIMGTASKYWRLVRIDAKGGYKVEVIDSLAAFFRQEFGLASGVEVQDALIQRRLLDLVRHSASENDRIMAEGCLRCFISNQIERICIQLEEQFGSEHGFTRYDLFSFVLDDVDVAMPQHRSYRQGVYQSLATEILQTFNPERGSLSTWATQLTKHYSELHSFLLERGVYLVSDWAILNDTTLKRAQRIFSYFHHLTSVEIQQACLLLESYHLVYRRDRLKLRQGGGGGKCQPPTEGQLEQMAQFLLTKLSGEMRVNFDISTENILMRLQNIAGKLRQYRISVRRGSPQTESLDEPENQSVAMRMQATAGDILEGNDEESEFLMFYRASFLECLDSAMEKIISSRITYLQRKKSPTSQQFLSALHLFHCRQRAMGEIAAEVGFQAQYQVTRLLKLKEFRADVRQKMLELLRSRILNKAKAYVDPDRLQTLDSQVEVALDERISSVITEATEEASNPNRSSKSLFSLRLCQHLKQILT